MIPEYEALLERIMDNCDLLARGSREKVEYVVPVKYGDGRIENEKRTRWVNRDSLLEQLRLYQQNKDTDRNPKAERGAPRVKTAGKPPGDLTGFFTLDEITCDAYSVLDKIFEEGERDRGWLVNPIADIFKGLHYQVKQFIEARPDLARDVVKGTDKWVRQAKSALRMTVSDAMFGGSVCGNCNGGLAVAWDNASDVRCVGTPTQPPCGETYPMSEWVALYEKGRRG